MDQSVKLSKCDCPQISEQVDEMRNKPYRALVGCLLYIALCTRPDIGFAVSRLIRFPDNPGLKHWRSAIQVLRYLKTTSKLGIGYTGGKSSVTLEGYADADLGNDPDDRRSVSGVIVRINDGPVMYKAKARSSVALSSIEAEYMALSNATQDGVWVRQLLRNLGTAVHAPILTKEDNQGAIALSKNAGYSARTKHTNIHHHYIRERIADQQVVVEYKETQHQLADIMTKQLSTPRFVYLRDRIVTPPFNNDDDSLPGV